jgi:hypothetical protein
VNTEFSKKASNYLKKHGYNINIICSSNIDDFILLFYAPAVISSGSSYSFMSGFFGNGKLISEGHFNEENSLESNCSICDNWLKKKNSILHKNINSYHETKIVINLLEN